MKLPEELKHLLEDMDDEDRWEAIARDCAKVCQNEKTGASATYDLALTHAIYSIFRRYGMEPK